MITEEYLTFLFLSFVLWMAFYGISHNYTKMLVDDWTPILRHLHRICIVICCIIVLVTMAHLIDFASDLLDATQ